MAKRVLSLRAMREQHDQAERVEQAKQSETETDTDTETDSDSSESETPTKGRKARTRKTAEAKAPKEKASAKPRVRKKAVKALPRMFAKWAVCDNVMKRVAVFDYKDRDKADAKLVELRERKPGAFFIILIKEPHVPSASEQPIVLEAVVAV